MSVAEEIVWPRDDYSRVPFRLYHDRDIFEREPECNITQTASFSSRHISIK